MIAIPLNRRTAVGSALAIASIIGISAFVLHRSQEVGSKPEWAALQWVELNYRDKGPTSLPLVLTVGSDKKYRVIGLRTPNNVVAWILLNPEHRPYYKQLPESEIILPTQTELQEISNETVHPEVMDRLQGNNK